MLRTGRSLGRAPPGKRALVVGNGSVGSPIAASLTRIGVVNATPIGM
jgi:tRNA A37 threonylcarbamoyladenosine dehydratase